MNIIQSQMQKYCLMGFMNALVVGGAIASSEGYASAQLQVLRRPLCMPSICNLLVKDVAHSPAIELDLILIFYPQAIADLKKEDQFAVQRLRLGDLATIQKLEQLAPGSTLRLQSSLPQLIQQPQQLNQFIVSP
jgi:endonuclease/exonuclease/phosphatase (EEP) superfamily protein YafD